MVRKIISPDRWRPLVAALLQRQRVMAPVVRNGMRAFEWVTDAAEVELLGALPRVAAKGALLPRSEVLFFFRAGPQAPLTATPPEPAPQVLLGLAPCDAQAVRVLDAVFLAEPYADGPYAARRRVTTIVGLGGPGTAPALPLAEQLGISPMDPAGCDAFLTPLPDGSLLLEVLTDKGLVLAPAYEALPDAPQAAVRQLEKWRQAAARRVSRDLDTEGFRARVWASFDAAFWEEIAERCVACGTCTYLCPTCHCFDIQDETRRGRGARVRNWDTCQFEVFTRHASGHNPRPGQGPRLRQRVLHKFHYGPVNFGLPFCVGCGRCITYCPVGIDLREALRAIETVRAEPEAHADRADTEKKSRAGG